MDDELRRRLTDRAFLFDDPHAYLAGVDAALRAVAEQDERGGPLSASRPHGAGHGVELAGRGRATHRL